MYERPDYATARERAGFAWSVAGTQDALRALTGIPIREFNLNPEACIEAYRRGRPLLAERFGPDVAMPGVSTPAVSYGHPNTLGSELRFPEGGEVAHTPIYRSLQEGIEALRQPVDFLSRGMAPFYLEFRERLRQAFPGEPVGFSFGLEGPITTAYELRGQDFFADLMEDTPLALRYLEAVVDSILAYHGALCQLDGRPAVSPSGAGMCDDCASFIAPRMWPEVVLPAWERYYRGMTTGRRTAHVEDLREEHLPYLEEIGLSFFDPSISPRLSPPIIARACRVPFLWRLGSFHCVEMTVRQVEDFVYQSVADGANRVVTYVSAELCDDAGAAKVRAFIAAAKEAKRLLDAGGSRAEVGERVSPEGRATLWEGWCGFLGPRSTRGGAAARAAAAG